jgi:hypothetical protein
VNVLRRVLRRSDLAALGFTAVALAIYVLSNPLRANIYNHFVWQAEAFLAGRFAIPWPVFTGGGTGFGNSYFLDVMPLASMPGFGLVPYPPLPAVLLLPIVAVLGQRTDAALLAAFLGAINVGLAWRVAARVTPDRGAAVAGTILYGFGTVAWYAAMLGSTWFLAHVVASTALLLSIAIAIEGDRRSGMQPLTGVARMIHPRQFGAGLVFGLAALARLTTIFGAPFFVLVGSGRSARRRALSAGIGAALPAAVLVAYNLASTGEPFHPAYEYAYRTESAPRPELAHPEWNAEDPRYVPQNLGIMFASLPVVRPECWQTPLDPLCPLVQPDPLGMSILLTSPAYVLIGGLLFARRRRPERLDAPVAAGPPGSVGRWELDPAALAAEAGSAADPGAAGFGATFAGASARSFHTENRPETTAGLDTPGSIWPRSLTTTGPRVTEPPSLGPHASDSTVPAARARFERRLAAGAALATVCIALVNLAHFSQGWVQFGYRFSNDFAPFALVLVTLGIARIGVGALTVLLVALSVIVNAWGVYWGVVLRW